MPFRAARVDDNQSLVVKALRKAGASVQHLHNVGFGTPDLLVGYKNKTILMEVKDGSKIPSQQRLSPIQTQWVELWRGGPVIVVTGPEDAIRWLVTLTAPKVEYVRRHVIDVDMGRRKNDRPIKNPPVEVG